MKISTFLISSMVLSTSILGIGLFGYAAEPGTPNSPVDNSTPAAPADIPPGTPTGSPTAAPSGSSDPPSTTTTPITPAESMPSPASSTPSVAPEGGGSLSGPSGGVSTETSAAVIATCGHGGATFLFENETEVSVGCRVSQINRPPAAAMK
ncbi:MAG: hypothetical protein WCD18_13175 [Thermosynechococcaceae cyanobacterium]